VSKRARARVARTLLLPLFVVTMVAGGCARRDDVDVRVTYEAGRGAAPLEDLTVFVGGSKSWWPTVSGGDSVRVLLSPQGEPPTLTITFRLGGVARDWRGPALQKGAGYSVAVRIAADGQVREADCRAPCRLP
jgi:hypothetical protein